MLTFNRISKDWWTFSIDDRIVGEAKRLRPYVWKIDIFEHTGGWFWADTLIAMHTFVEVWFAKEPEGE